MLPHPDGAIETVRARNGSLKDATPPSAIVQRFYGNAAQATSAVYTESASFGDWPIELWGVNYPAFGKSEGSVSLRGVARAAEVAYEAAAATGLPIYVVGTSMGTTAALHLGATRSVAGLVLINPPPLRQLIRGRYGWWNLWLLAGPISLGVPEALDSIDNARHTRARTFVITAGADSLVLPEYQDGVYEALAGSKDRAVVPGIDHNDAIPDEVWQRAERALREPNAQ
jgi:pimeloyl-ACP methyl ester carboxylesterase